MYFLYASPLTVDALDVRSELQLLRPKALHMMFFKKQHCIFEALSCAVTLCQGCFVRRRLSSIPLSNRDGLRTNMLVLSA